MQVVYYGSYCKVEEPKIVKGKFTKDFGEGFYCTILKEQAERWSQKYENSYVNSYLYTESSKLKVKEFSVMTEE